MEDLDRGMRGAHATGVLAGTINLIAGKEGSYAMKAPAIFFGELSGFITGIDRSKR